MKLPTLIFAALAGVATMAAAQAPNPLYLGRIGLFNEPRFTSPGPPFYQDSFPFELTDSGYALGSSKRFDTSRITLQGGRSYWATNTITGITKEIASLDPATWDEQTVHGITEHGIVYGNVNIFAPSPFPGFETFSLASWAADAETGVTLRTGFYHAPEYADSNGFAVSATLGATDNGVVFGTSFRMSPYSGNATWILNTDNGVISRVGFTTADYTSGNTQSSTITGASNLGYVTGYSERYTGAGFPPGQTAWVAAGITGGTYLVGLYQPPLYLRPDGYGHTYAATISESGYVIGDSARFNGSADVGRAAWIHNLTGNTAKRVGLTTAEFTDSTTGTQISNATHVSEGGHVGGISKRFSGATDLGQAAWVASFTDAIAVRAGLTGAEFTTSTGYQFSELAQMANPPSLYNFLVQRLLPIQGNAFGTSQRYISDEPKGRAAWVFNKSTGVTTLVGLYNTPEYVDTDGTVESDFIYDSRATDTGWAVGRSATYTPSGDRSGFTTWAASANTGATIPIGFYGPDYTGTNGIKFTGVTGIHPDGHVFGTSRRYVSGASLGQAAWAVNLNTTSTTVRIGFFGTPEYLLANGSENTVIGGSTQSGYVWGYSSRAESSGGGQTAWVYNLLTGTQQTFQIQVAPDGKSSTTIYRVTENGLISGTYAAYDPITSAPLGKKNFVWSPAKGLVILETQLATALSTNNWTGISSFILNRHGLIVAHGARGTDTAANPGGSGVFRAYFAP